MAITEIKSTIQDVTGVTASTDFIESAQRFVVSSVPKNLLHFAQTASSASTDGSAISFSINDSIIDVQRNGYSCKEIPLSESVWALDSSSLKYATSRHPVWYHKQGSVHFAPVTDGSNAGYVFYIDYSKIDDDCDLRNAVIYHAVSFEFEKIASSKINDLATITRPTEPVYLKNLTSFNATAPVYNGAGNNVVSVYDPVSWHTYYNDGGKNPHGVLHDPGMLSIQAVAPSQLLDASFSEPAIADETIDSTIVSNLGTPPVYTAPAVGGATEEITSLITTGNSVGDFSDWFDVVGDFIQTDEDVELAQAQIQKINTYIQSYQTAITNQLNIFNDANVEYQAKLQEGITQANINAQKAQQESQLAQSKKTQLAQLKLQKENQEYSSKLQNYSAKLSEYQAQVGKEVQEYTTKFNKYQLELNNSYTAWAKEQSDKLQKFQLHMTHELNTFNEANVVYQSELQIAIQDAQLKSQQDALELQSYSAKLQDYSNAVNEAAQRVSLGTGNASFYSAESKKYYEWAKMEITSYIQNNSKTIGMNMAQQQAQAR